MKVFTLSTATGLLALTAPSLSKRIVVGGTTLSVFDFNPSTNQLTLLGTNGDLGRNPSWQQFSKDRTLLLSSAEGNWGQPQSGKVGTFRVPASGNLGSAVSQGASLWGTVSVDDDGKGNLFSASYDSNAVLTYRLDSNGQITAREQFKFTMPQPGPNRGRQDAPHPHQVLFDPTNTFLFVPDLGADITRIFTIGSNGQLNALQNLVSAPGSGPRHGIFYPNVQGQQPTNFYLIHELSNTVVAHNVTYGSNTIDLKPTQTLSTYGDRTVPAVFPSPTAAEMAISPDGKFLYASNRSDRLLANGQSDSIAIYSRDVEGRLAFKGLTEAGGIGPRHFSLDSTGEFLVSGLGGSNRIVVFRRNANDGSLTKLAEASAQVPACVTFID